MSVSRLARPYAETLLDSAPAGWPWESFLDGGEAIARALSSDRALRAVMSNPAVALERKEAVLAALARRAGLDDLALRFLRLLLHRKRLLQLSDIMSALRELRDERAGVTPASIAAAHELDARQRASIAAALSRTVGKTVRPEFSVDPSLLAGFVARVGSRVFDASAAGAINKFREEAYGNQG